MKDVYKIIKSTSILPWQKWEVWMKGEEERVDVSNFRNIIVKEVVTRCIHKTSTEQKAQEYIAYWESVSAFKLGEVCESTETTQSETSLQFGHFKRVYSE